MLLLANELNSNLPKKKSSGRRSTNVFRGNPYTPLSNPPGTTAQPWRPLVISSINAPGDYTFTSLIEDFQAQLNTSKFTFNTVSFNTDTGTPFRIQIRLEKVSVWNLTGKILSLSVWEIPEPSTTQATTEKTQLGSWVDCGGPSCFPSVGYNYPESHRHRVYRPDPLLAKQVILSTTSAAGDRILCHLHILCKTDGFPKFPTVGDIVSESLRNIEASTGALSSASKPSIVDHVVDGAALTLLHNTSCHLLSDSLSNSLAPLCH